MRTQEERETLFVEVAKRSVRKCFSKRLLAKREFCEDEMKEIKEIDAFLRKVSLSRMDDLEKQVLGYTNYFCVAIRVKVKLRGEELETFIHQYILEKDFDYKKVEYYVAKGIYLANQNKHFEVYYCVNLLRPRYGEGGHCMPRRTTRNVTMTSCIFCDLDLEEPYASLDDATLLEKMREEKGEILEALHPMLVRSGQGVHMYVMLEESLDLTNEKTREYWKNLCTTLAFLLRDYNADIKVVDVARILRCVNSVNRKEKYEEGGRKVNILLDSNERIYVEDLEKQLQFLMQGGVTKLYEDILSDIVVDDDMDYGNRDFYAIDFDDDIFVDEVMEYQPPIYFVDCYRHLKEHEKEGEGQTNEQEGQTKYERCVREISIRKVKQSKKDNYKGIVGVYDDFPQNMMWQNKDLLFWISNRTSVEGYRNYLVFFLSFNMYYFENIRSSNMICEKIHMINNKYIRPMISDKEIRIQTKLFYDKFSKQIRTRYIRNETIQKYFPFKEEEKKYTIGNYYEIDSKEYVEKNKERHRKDSLNYYYDKKRDNMRLDYYQALEKMRKDDCEVFIRNHPFASFGEAKEKISIGENQYYAMRKSIQIELGVYKEKGNIYEPFEKDIHITYKEYNELFPCTKCTFFRRRKRYKNLIKE